MSALENYIHHYFSIGVEDCKKVSGLFKTETLAKGNYFLKEGKYCNKMSFIREGILRIFESLPEREVTQWIGTRVFFYYGCFLLYIPKALTL
jgi:hypothetical protein